MNNPRVYFKTLARMLFTLNFAGSDDRPAGFEMGSRLIIGVMLVAAPSPAQDLQPLNDDYQAYWLTDSKIESGEAYGPLLLLTRAPIPQLKHYSDLRQLTRNLGGNLALPLLESPALWLTTNKKDSIWNQDRCPIKPATNVTMVDETKRLIVIEGRSYKYERASIDTAYRLLKSPYGQQSLHRLHAPYSGARQTARALTLLLADQIERRKESKPAPDK